MDIKDLLNLSMLHFYSVGIVSEDKKYYDEDGNFSPIIQVVPIEKLRHIRGKLSDKESIDDVAKDIADNIEVIKGEFSHTITARWFNLGRSNRESPPDVSLGEKVMLLKFGMSEDVQYYWMEYGDSLTLRGKEIMKFFCINTDDNTERKDDDNSHWMIIDAVEQIIHIHTSDNQGEKASYDLVTDMKAGVVKMYDDKGNKFTFDSVMNKGTYTVNINDLYDLTVPHINIENETYKMNTKKSVILDNETYKMTTRNTIDVSAGEHYSIVTDKYEVRGNGKELLTVLADTFDKVRKSMIIGNLGKKAPFSPSDIAAIGDGISDIKKWKV